MKKDTLKIVLETEWKPGEIKTLFFKNGDKLKEHLIEKIKTAKKIAFTAKKGGRK